MRPVHLAISVALAVFGGTASVAAATEVVIDLPPGMTKGDEKFVELKFGKEYTWKVEGMITWTAISSGVQDCPFDAFYRRCNDGGKGSTGIYTRETNTPNSDIPFSAYPSVTPSYNSVEPTYSFKFTPSANETRGLLALPYGSPNQGVAYGGGFKITITTPDATPSPPSPPSGGGTTTQPSGGSTVPPSSGTKPVIGKTMSVDAPAPGKAGSVPLPKTPASTRTVEGDVSLVPPGGQPRPPDVVALSVEEKAKALCIFGAGTTIENDLYDAALDYRTCFLAVTNILVEADRIAKAKAQCATLPEPSQPGCLRKAELDRLLDRGRQKLKSALEAIPDAEQEVKRRRKLNSEAIDAEDDARRDLRILREDGEISDRSMQQFAERVRVAIRKAQEARKALDDANLEVRRLKKLRDTLPEQIKALETERASIAVVGNACLLAPIRKRTRAKVTITCTRTATSIRVRIRSTGKLPKARLIVGRSALAPNDGTRLAVAWRAPR